jgi:DNA-binding MarR family transcriptional regulator
MDASREEQARRIQIALQHIKRRLDAASLKAAEQSITVPQMYMLYFIKKEEKCRLTQLADRFGVKPSAITVMVDRLEKAGYVKRFPDPDDRRSMLAGITPAGKEALERALRARSEVLIGHLSRLDETEVSVFLRLLEKFAGVTEEND